VTAENHRAKNSDGGRGGPLAYDWHAVDVMSFSPRPKDSSTPNDPAFKLMAHPRLHPEADLAKSGAMG